MSIISWSEHFTAPSTLALSKLSVILAIPMPSAMVEPSLFSITLVSSRESPSSPLAAPRQCTRIVLAVAVDQVDLDGGVGLLEELAAPADSAACAGRTDEAVELVLGLLPNLGRCSLVVREEVGLVVELVREDGVGVRLGESRCHVEEFLLSVKGTMGHTSVRAPNAFIIATFSSEACWGIAMKALYPLAAAMRERATPVLPPEPSQFLEESLLLSIVHYPQGGSVLDAAAGVEVLELDDDLAARLRRERLYFDEGRVPNGANDPLPVGEELLQPAIHRLLALHDFHEAVELLVVGVHVIVDLVHHLLLLARRLHALLDLVGGDDDQQPVEEDDLGEGLHALVEGRVLPQRLNVVIDLVVLGVVRMLDLVLVRGVIVNVAVDL
eukprot:CAMPEP_0168628056 /NCGR_PEP_ID=MMETSP0449_2-20121227/11634_1 /TAXON_ID=1082188 /ORGANISM="Strombidium rassoulzadegani, Strain ras09" /LENGTH=382 /DNA_ID=CAMNT_0008670437 /DNA_START=268 /DNA_END=1416 /DNA_ORIENTATION=-